MPPCLVSQYGPDSAKFPTTCLTVSLQTVSLNLFSHMFKFDWIKTSNRCTQVLLKAKLKKTRCLAFWIVWKSGRSIRKLTHICELNQKTINFFFPSTPPPSWPRRCYLRLMQTQVHTILAWFCKSCIKRFFKIKTIGSIVWLLQCVKGW